jgi:drug/metabolite transporter (DMT)-like permease
VLSTLILWPAQGRALWHTQRPWLHVARGLLLFCSSLFAFASLRFVPVGEFTAIVMITPLVITLIANRFMNEAVSGWRWFFVCGGFVGALMIVRPGGEGFSLAWLLPVVVVFFNSGFQLLTSVLARTENPSTTHFFTGWVGTAVATLALPFAWTNIDDPSLWLRMLLMGFMGALGHFCLTIAYTRAPAATLTPYLYGQIGTAMLMGWLVLGHVPDQWGVAGMLVIAVCGGASAWLSARALRRTS